MSSLSAADWLAPYARHPNLTLYADDAAIATLEDTLELHSPARGANVFVDVIDDQGIFLDSIDAAPGIRTTGLVQTYLDLEHSGGRAIEAAEHLRRIKMPDVFRVDKTTG